MSAPSSPTSGDHAQEPHQRQNEIAAIGSRARRGVVLLALRTVGIQLIVLGGQVVLARLLEPRDFGVFAIVQFALTFFTFFGDAGLGGGLIQQKQHPNSRELSSVFVAQLFMSLAVVALVWLTSGLLLRIWPDLPASAVWVLRALSISLLLTSVRTLPAILMERDLQFGRLGTLDVALSAAFYVTASILAAFGWGIWALTSAVLCQGVVGVILAYALHPYRPSLLFDRAALRPVIRFGVPFQLNRILGFLNSAVTPIYAGSVLGAAPVGLLNWAQTTAFFPLKLVEILGRVNFPLYSRLQEKREVMGESVGRSVQLCAAFTTFFVAIFWGIGRPLIHVIYGEKWMPALPLLHVYAMAICFGFLVPLIAPAFEATGRPKIVLHLSVFTTALNWVLVTLCTSRWRTLGFSLGYSGSVVIGNMVMIAVLVRHVPHTRLWRRVWAPVLVGLITYAVARYGCASFAGTIPGFCVCILGLAAVHVGGLFLLDRLGMKEALLIVPGAEKYVRS